MVDIYFGSITTRKVTDELERSWLSIEIDPKHARLSAVRFLEGESIASIREMLGGLERGEAARFARLAPPQAAEPKTHRRLAMRKRRIKAASSGQSNLF